MKQNANATDSATSVIGGNPVLVTSGQGRCNRPDIAAIFAASQRLSASVATTNIADSARKIVIITSTIGGLQIFDEPRMFDQTGQGGADGQWLTVTMYIYNLGWLQRNFGRAAAVAWLLFLLILLISLVNFLITRRIASEGRVPRSRKKVRA